MVVVGAPMSRSSGGVDEGKVCSVAYQRQHVHHTTHSVKSGVKAGGQPGGDALPVVELKPFTKKVWRREKSLPNFYDKPPPPPHGDEQAADTPRPLRSHAPPAPGIVRYIRELSEQRKTVETRQSADSTQRYRSKLHPKPADFKPENWAVAAEHQQDLIPSFITRHDRTKTTLNDETGVVVTIGGGGAMSASTAGQQPYNGPAGFHSAGGGFHSAAGGGTTDRSGVGGGGVPPGGGGTGMGLGRELSHLMSTYTRDKPLEQQQVTLTGGKLSTANVGRRPLLYLKPFSAYRQRQAWHLMRTENTPNTLSPRHASSLPLSPRNNSNNSNNSNNNNNNFLASTSANGHNATLRRDLVLSGSSLYAAVTEKAHAQPLLQPLRTPHVHPASPPHRFHSKLGAAQDSLLMLSRSGAPTVLEKNLSFDQEVRLDRCRRERSFAAIGDTNVLSSAHYVAYDSQPTRGEVTLMRAREANKSRDGSKPAYKRNGLQRPFPTIPSFGQGPVPNFMLGRAYENSSRSNKSEHGDSGIMSSPGEPYDDAGRGGDLAAAPAVLARGDLGENAIPEHPDEPGVGGDGRGGAALGVWAPGDSVAALDAADVESTDEHPHRALSDSAATDTMHVRNELTPMSAENKARMLPRDPSFGEESRGGTSHQARREAYGVTAIAPLPALATAASRPEPGADVITNNESQSASSTSSVALNLKVEPDQTADESRREEDGGTNSTEDAADTTATTGGAPSAPGQDVATSSFPPVIVPAASDNEDNRSEESHDKTPARKVSQEGRGGGGDEGLAANQAEDLMLVSVNSNAPSHANIDSARDPALHIAGGGIPEQDKEQHPRENDTTPIAAPPENTSKESTDVDTKPEHASDEPGHINTESSSAENPEGLSKDIVVDGNGQASSRDTDADPTAPKDASRPEEAEEKAEVTSSIPPDTEGGSQAPDRAPETDTKTPGVVDSEQNVTKTAPSAVAVPNSTARREQSTAEAHPADDGKDVSPGRVSDTSVNAATVKSEPALETVTKDCLPSGEEGEAEVAAVTTGDVQSKDNFDGSKTFLTTTNTDSEEFQNLVKA